MVAKYYCGNVNKKAGFLIRIASNTVLYLGQ